MSKISNSIKHLIRGKFLIAKKATKETDNITCLELAKSGYITRDNLLRNFIAGVQGSPIISNEHQITMSSYERSKHAFDSCLLHPLSCTFKAVKLYATFKAISEA